MVGEDEDFVIDSYRLAHYYHCNPEIFLAMPLSEMHEHLRNTIRLAELEREEIERDA